MIYTQFYSTYLNINTFMRKLIYCVVLALCGNSSALSAQNLMAYTPENSRMVVDGITENYFNLKRKKRQESEVRQSLHGCLFYALDGQGTGFYGIKYNFAYPIKSFETSGLYIGVNPALGGSASGNSRTGGSFEFGVDLPIMLEYHLGDPEALGGVFGVGFAYNFINSSYSSIPHKAMGPAFEAGLSAPIAGRVYSLKGTFQLNLTKKTVGTGNDAYSTGNVIGISAGIVF
jgi:hypothetical protein